VEHHAGRKARARRSGSPRTRPENAVSGDAGAERDRVLPVAVLDLKGELFRTLARMPLRPSKLRRIGGGRGDGRALGRDGLSPSGSEFVAPRIGTGTHRLCDRQRGLNEAVWLRRQPHREPGASRNSTRSTDTGIRREGCFFLGGRWTLGGLPGCRCGALPARRAGRGAVWRAARGPLQLTLREKLAARRSRRFWHDILPARRDCRRAETVP